MFFGDVVADFCNSKVIFNFNEHNYRHILFNAGKKNSLVAASQYLTVDKAGNVFCGSNFADHFFKIDVEKLNICLLGNNG